MKLPLFFLFLIGLISCKKEPNSKTSASFKTKELALKYAKGFSVEDNGNYKVLTILKPWPKASHSYKYIIASNEVLSKMTFSEDSYNGIIISDIKKIVVTSTTHIPALELLGIEQMLVGFPGTDYISSSRTRKLIEKGKVRDLGKNEGINTERLLELNPDVIIGFGIDGVNKTFEIIKKAKIPVIYSGDWVESSALAKAEWIKLFGVLFNKEREADSIFNSIEKNYLSAKILAKQAKNKPTILSGAMHKEAWYLPYGSSSEAQFLNDANVNYLWSETTGNGSLMLSFETVFNKAKQAEVWLNPSYYESLKQLKKANTLYTNFNAFKKQSIYTFSMTKGSTGGVLYYELGTIRPDLVLKDLIKICHPELLDDYIPYFFKKLE